MSPSLAPVGQRALVRALTWALIGAIYAPLFAMLREVVAPSLGLGALVVAAATAGAVGAAFYGARQVALAAALVGVAASWLVLLLAGDAAAYWMAALLASVAAFAIGYGVDFPSRCTLRVPAKVVTGALTGAGCGALLVGVTGLSGLTLSAPVIVAFLVSVNGVLYVALLPRLIDAYGAPRGRWCDLTESLVIALVALVVAASVWGFAGLLADQPTDPLARTLLAVMWDLPGVVLAGIAAGAITGALLEVFDFAWAEGQ